MSGQVGTIIAFGGGIFIWAIAASIANDTACASIRLTSQIPPVRVLTELALLCWFV